MVDPLQFHCYRLVGTFHSKNGVKFFLHDVKKRVVILFGTLSPTLTFKLKIQTWLEVCNHLVAAGFPPGAKKQLRNGRTCRWPRPVRPNTPNESRLGRVLQIGLTQTNLSPRYSEKEIPPFDGSFHFLFKLIDLQQRPLPLLSKSKSNLIFLSAYLKCCIKKV